MLGTRSSAWRQRRAASRVVNSERAMTRTASAALASGIASLTESTGEESISTRS